MYARPRKSNVLSCHSWAITIGVSLARPGARSGYVQLFETIKLQGFPGKVGVCCFAFFVKQ